MLVNRINKINCVIFDRTQNEIIKLVINKYYSIEYTINLNNKLNKISKIDDYITYPIKTLHISKPKRGEERVYDLSVEDDNSFIVGNYNVHNCYRIGQQNDVNIYYQLFDKTISTKMWSILKGKREVINTILGAGNLSDDQITEIIMNEIVKNEEE